MKTEFGVEPAERHPSRVAFCDASFAFNAFSVNVEQTSKQISPNTEVKTI